MNIVTSDFAKKLCRSYFDFAQYAGNSASFERDVTSWSAHRYRLMPLVAFHNRSAVSCIDAIMIVTTWSAVGFYVLS